MNSGPPPYFKEIAELQMDTLLYIVPASIIAIGVVRICLHMYYIRSTHPPKEIPQYKVPKNVLRRLHKMFDEQNLSHNYTVKQGKYQYYWDGHATFRRSRKVR